MYQAENAIKIVIGAGALFLASVFNMLVLSTLWGWYITPEFNVAVPKLYILYGLVLTASFFTHSNMNDLKNTTFSDQLFTALLKGLVLLTLGWMCQAMFA
jgi:hypothetical protein